MFKLRYYILIGIFSLNTLSCSSQFEISVTKKPTNLAVSRGKIKGAIFTENYLIFPPVVNTPVKGRFTPTKEDIILVEALLKAEFRNLNKSNKNKFSDSYFIEKNLPYYFRQYVGYISVSGDKVIHINCHWNKYPLRERLKGFSDQRLHFENDYMDVLDGGNRHWQINVNLTQKKLFDLQVNGVA